jgi:hypothetical protein
VHHNSATTHTHKVQRLHTVVGANRVGDGARAVVADFIVELWNNADEEVEMGEIQQNWNNSENNLTR